MLILDVKILNKPQEETLVGSVFSHINTSFTDIYRFTFNDLLPTCAVSVCRQ